jgi:hypothetical protein
MEAAGYRGLIFIARGLCHGWKAGDEARIEFDHKRKVSASKNGRRWRLKLEGGGVRLMDQAHRSGRGAKPSD